MKPSKRIPRIPAATPAEASTKSERTRARILEAALALFASEGFGSATLRAIAERAGCSLGLTYRYFPSKEALVLAAYEDIALRLEARAHDLPEGTLATRFAAAMKNKLELLAPHRDAFGALFASALDPASRVSVLGEAARSVRSRVMRVFERVVDGASDAPPHASTKDVAVVLYATHLALLLVWLHDKSRGARATTQALTLARDAIAFAAPTLHMPVAHAALARVSSSLRPIFHGEPS